MSRLRSTLVLVWLVCLVSPALARTYYVAKNGSDSNPGTSWGTSGAWLTINKVNSTVVHGDTVRFGTGNWFGSQIQPPSGSTAGAPTVYSCSTYATSGDLDGSDSWHKTQIWSGEVITGWTLNSGHVYRASWTPANTDRNGNYDSSFPCIVSHDSIFYMVGSVGAISRAGYACNSGGTLYLWPYRTGTPDTVLASARAVVDYNSDCDYITYYGLNLKMGIQGAINFSGNGGGSSNNLFAHCTLAHATHSAANNCGVVAFMGDDGNYYYDNVFRACNIYSATAPIGDESHMGNGVTTYDAKRTVFDSCYFSMVPGTGIHFKNCNVAAPIGDNRVSFCTFDGTAEMPYGIDSYECAGVRLTCRPDHDSIYGCVFLNLDAVDATTGTRDQGGRGIMLYVNTSAEHDYGSEFFCNNTFYNCNNFFYWENLNSPDAPEFVKYNVGYGIENNYFLWDYNSIPMNSLATIDSNTWFDPALAFNGRYGGASHNWTQWRSAGFDTHGLNANPNFANPAGGDFSRPSVTEMNRTYGGRTWTKFGAVQSGGGVPDIAQNISNSSNNNSATLIDNLSNGTVPYDSLVLHWGPTRSSVANLSARDSRITGATNPDTLIKSGLNSATKYYFRILAYDAGAFGDTSAIDSLTTSSAAVHITQIITESSTNNSAALSDDLSGGTAPYDSLILHWSTTRANVVSLAARDTKVTAASDPYVFNKLSLSPSTKYYFRVLAFDAGAIADTSAIDSVTTTAAPVHIAQVITESSTNNSAALSDDLSGGTAPYDSLILHWSTTRANVVSLAARDTKVTAASDPYVFAKTLLSPSTKYYYRVIAFDAGAIADTSAIDSVTTLAQPAIDQVVSKTISETQISLGDDISGGSVPYDSLILYWSTSRANVVNLSARDTKVTATADPYQFSKTGLTANTKYYFRISAFDLGSLGDTTTIDSSTTSAAGMTLLSVNVPDTVSGTYSGYSQTPVNDGVMAPRGGTASTWASDESATSAHWVTVFFSSPKVAQRVSVNWAWNSSRSAYMTSRQYNIQYWDASGSIFRDAAVVNNSMIDSATTTDFTPITTTRIRYYQPANMGPSTYASILWITELQVYGTDQQDVTPPALSGIIASNIASTTATVNWNSNEPATSQVEYGLTTGYGMSTVLDNSLLLNHTQSISGLTPSTIYHYRVKSGDAAGNLATSGDYTLTTTVAPVHIAQIIIKNSTFNSVTISDDLSGSTAPYDSLILHWSTTRANVVSLAARDTKVTAASDPYVFAKTLLSPSTKYYFRVLAFDAGVIADTSAIDSVTTTSAAVHITQIITKSSTSNSAALSDDLSNGTAPYDSLILHWSTTKANVVNLAARDTKVTAASDPYVFNKSSLSPSTKYYFRVLAFDAGATADTSAIDSVTTTAAPVHIAQVITESSTNNSAALSDDLSNGTAPYDSLILHWSTTRANVVSLAARDTKVTAASDPYVFAKTLLSPSTKYYFRVLAFDAGAIADTSAIDSVTTTVQGLQLLSVNVPDTVSGTYSGYSQTPVNDGIMAPRGGTVSTWASDESATSAHWVTIYFSSSKVVQRVSVSWAWNSYRSAFMTSRQYNIQYWDASGSIFRDAAVVNNSTIDSATTTDLTPITTTRIRYYQPANMGPSTYASILWITELQVWGNDAALSLNSGGGDTLSNNEEIPPIIETRISGAFPTEYSLGQSYPNPFNAQTTIEYGLPEASAVRIEIYDVLGRKVETLVDEFQEAGSHQVIWNAGGQSSGTYLYHIEAGKFSETKKTVLLK